MRIVALAVAATLVPTAALADFSGRVVHIQDGDTLTVLVEKTQVRVRLDAIDAPEAKQAFGTRSRQSLAELCAGKSANVADLGKDRYRRTIGRVTCAGVDANSEQVRRGMAWVFVKYAPAGSSLYALEAEANAAKRGLWSDPHAVAPWEWRQQARRNR
jgi:endonuclease YncB( thermonuclease family)